MNTRSVGRIFWKDFRGQRDFLLAVIAAGVFIQMVVILLHPMMPEARADKLGHWGPVIAFIVGCGFAVGSASFLFAGEKESKTLGLLQRIPVGRWELTLAKLTSLACGTALVFAALGLMGVVIGALGHSSWAEIVADLPASLADAVPALASAFLIVSCVLGFSLLLEDILLSIVLGFVLAVGGIAFADVWIDDPLKRWLFPRLLVAACALTAAVDLYLTRHWLRGMGISRLSAWAPTIRWRNAPARPATWSAVGAVRSPIEWRRSASSHAWNQWRQVRSVGSTVLAAAALLFALSARGGGSQSHFAPLAMIFGLAVPGILGVAAFRGDQSGRAYRLLSNHGVSPDGYWWTKQLVWLATVLVVCGLLIGLNDLVFVPWFTPAKGSDTRLWGLAGEFASLSPSREGGMAASTTERITVIVCYVLLMYSIAQLAGLLVPRTLGAAFVAVFAWVGMAIVWSTVNRYEIPFGWTIGVCPLIFFAASWLRVGDWLAQRNTPAAWSKIAAASAIPAACLFMGAISYRVVEIPIVSTAELYVAAAPSQAGRGSDAAFAAAFAALVPPDNAWMLARIGEKGWNAASPADKKWVAENHEALRLAIEAASRQSAAITLPAVSRERLRELLLCKARERESQDRLDEALPSYVAAIRLQNGVTQSQQLGSWLASESLAENDLWWMSRWAAHPKQTAERVKRGIETIERTAPLPPISESIARTWKLEVMAARESVAGPGRSAAREEQLAELFPWERARVLRLADALCAASFSASVFVEQQLAGGETLPGFGLWSDRPFEHDAPWKFVRATPAIDAALDKDTVRQLLFASWAEMDAVSIRRMQLIGLAICGWRREHGRLPIALEELVPDYFDRLPQDPGTGAPFRYFPQGINRLAAVAVAPVPTEPFLAASRLPGSHVEHFRAVRRHVPCLDADGRQTNGPRWQFDPAFTLDAVRAPIRFDAPIVAIPAVSLEKPAGQKPPAADVHPPPAAKNKPK